MSIRKGHLAAYDIADDGRRRRCARLMLDHGMRCQKSVFDCRIAPGEIGTLLDQVGAVLDMNEDRLILLPVSMRGAPAGLGLGETAVVDTDQLVIA